MGKVLSDDFKFFLSTSSTDTTVFIKFSISDKFDEEALDAIESLISLVISELTLSSLFASLFSVDLLLLDDFKRIALITSSWETTLEEEKIPNFSPGSLSKASINTVVKFSPIAWGILTLYSILKYKSPSSVILMSDMSDFLNVRKSEMSVVSFLTNMKCSVKYDRENIDKRAYSARVLVDFPHKINLLICPGIRISDKFTKINDV